ncbi:glycosyltransferase [Acinetobacter lwoffii]|uniref:Glycosyltransferase 2-like domain-containing protein n=1 Tax=Acinetobacter lwoffii NCTC 5866 = CIP 64.10 = NIPH 512 TaxID=981327 RepID=A0ABN0PVN1_ACILW|nr:glycosyltransferase [Acinetobacter lwoffii]ESJ94577.1 hypothetical protein P800_02670 [Acinetobacter lwoffii NCTC 5866 = CIP 64.10 = NIPH 512]
MINFSVLMSLYYKEKKDFLDSSLVSIWSTQILKPNEIVIVLDGPVDYELQECIATWQNKIESVLKIVPLQKNIGLGKALNEGLKHCSYEWVFRMDTDDICTPDRFQKQVDFIMSNPDTVLFGGQVLEFDQNPDDSAVIKTVPTTHEDIKKFAKNRCPFNHMTVAYKKSVIMKLGGYQHHLFMEDYNLWLRIIGAGYEVANLEDVVLYARVGNGMHARRKGYEYVKRALLHKPICKGFFSDIIFK